ncbi:MAG: dihydropteroate synthase [Cellvibrionaceae bacterium]|jgi:dihydropteroate synthase
MIHRLLKLSRPRLMAIVNTTPDSFSDGGSLFNNGKVDANRARDRIEKLTAQGAEIIDIGGESTRPGANPIGLQEELDRVIPLVEWSAKNIDVAISVDTSTPEVIDQAARSGAHLINDVRALSRDDALDAVAKAGLPVCLMHMQGTPKNMQTSPVYENVLTQVSTYLQDRVLACLNAGIPRDHLWLDPGFGFGKTLEHNLTLLTRLPELVGLGFPVMVGFSRKSMIGKLLARELPDRLPGSLALAMMALERGAKILRVHDVAATRDIIDSFLAVTENSR